MSSLLNSIVKKVKARDPPTWVPFKNKYSLEERQAEYLRIKRTYPAKIPVIVEPGNDQAPKIDRHKYLISPDLVIGQFVYSLRNRIAVGPEDALFFFINNKIPVMSEHMGSIYDSEKDTDNFVYIYYSKENAFGMA